MLIGENDVSLDHLKSRSFDAFLFDMDGTLLDSSAASERVWGAWARDNGIPTPPYHGRRVEDTMVDLVDFGIDVETAAAEVKERELNDLDGVVAIPGAAAFLQSLPEGKWTVATSASRELAIRRMRAAGLPVPATIIAAEDVTAGKPDPAPYLAAARLLSVDPSRCLVFEDADAGIASGEASGAPVMVITYTKGSERPGSGRIVDYTGVSVTVIDGTLRLEEKADHGADTVTR